MKCEDCARYIKQIEDGTTTYICDLPEQAANACREGIKSYEVIIKKLSEGDGNA